MKVYVVWGAIPYGVASIKKIFRDRRSAQSWIDSQYSPGYFEYPWAEEYWIMESSPEDV